MPRRIRYHADFKADLEAQLQWLETNRDERWISKLREAIDDASTFIARFPAVGTIERQEDDITLRRLICRDVPYVIWFASESKNPAADIWILRLFHARQERSTAALPKKQSARRKR